jgi:hypothetical protein
MEKEQAKEFNPSTNRNPTFKSKDLFQIMLGHGSLLILTREEFKKALLRGKSVIHNRLLKNRPLDSDILKGRFVKK